MRRDRARPLLRSFAAGSGGVVLIHPGALPVADYAALAAATGGAGFQVVDLEAIGEYVAAGLGDWSRPVSIRGLAERVAAELLDAGLPAGRRWILGGWSFGGVIAHAVSGLLPADRRPDRLVVLDSLAPVADFTHRGEHGLEPELVLPWFADYLAAKRSGAPTVLDFTGHTVESGLRLLLAQAIEEGLLRADTDIAGLRKVFAAYEGGLLRNSRLTREYPPERGQCALTLVRPERGLVSDPRPLGWDQLYDEVRVVSGLGDHYSVWRRADAIPVVAAALRSEKSGAADPIVAESA